MIPSLDFLLSQIMNGVVMGLIYALMAIGITLIFSIMKMVNFAHGEYYMMGGYIAYYIAQFGTSPLFSFFVAFVAVFCLGLIVERTLLRPAVIRNVERPGEYAIIVTFALSITLIQLALVVFGPFSKTPPKIQFIQWPVAYFFSIPEDRLFACIIASITVVAVLIFVKKTLIGRALEATAQDRDAAMLVGIDADRLGQIAYGIGTGLAAIAGCALASVFQVYPNMGTPVSSKAFAIVVLGGLGSIKGSIIAAVLFGLIEGFCMVFISTAYRDVYAFMVLIAVLVLRPRGLFGEKVRAV